MFIAGVDPKVAKLKEAAWGYKHFVPTARSEHDSLVRFVPIHHVAKPGAL